MRKPLSLLGFAFLGATCGALAAGNPELGEAKAAVCMGCHGPDGNSIALPPPADPWPKLAGQLPDYIVKQVHDFKAGKRKNEQMTPQAQAVAETDLADIAAFFAKQKPKAEEATNKELLASGEKLFRKGKGRPSVVPACIGCHGPDGVGNRDWDKLMVRVPSVLAPSIGGQHASYLVKQLKAYKDGSRANDEAKVMRDIASRLDESDIAAVAEYLSTRGH
jgi:cytochrome c553